MCDTVTIMHLNPFFHPSQPLRQKSQMAHGEKMAAHENLPRATTPLSCAMLPPPCSPPWTLTCMCGAFAEWASVGVVYTWIPRTERTAVLWVSPFGAGRLPPLPCSSRLGNGGVQPLARLEQLRISTGGNTVTCGPLPRTGERPFTWGLYLASDMFV